MKKLVTVLLLFLTTPICHAQVYTEKQTRHRFAQLNIGFDFQSSFGGSSKYLDQQGNIQSVQLSNSFAPRFLIGGTHFWGHADFYIAIPLIYPSFSIDNQKITAFRGVETVFKYYPYQIEYQKIRPYIGVSLAPFFFEHQNNYFQFPDGPDLNHISYPLLGGITYNAKNHLVELGFAWNYQNMQDYYISRTQVEKINTPPFYASLSYRYTIETTLSAEKNWESGKTKEITDFLASKGRLNSLYIGAGISSAFWLKQSSYNKTVRPYIGKQGISIMPDFTVGYYLHEPDLNFAIGYRSYGASTNSYGVNQQLRRNSILIESTKYLFDYQGFVPFIGPVISYENLLFQENFEGSLTLNYNYKKLGYGLTFGWDIRPNRIQSWILRTNLRWYPNLVLPIHANNKVAFDNLEFNFIQLIIYPNRLINLKSKKSTD